MGCCKIPLCHLIGELKTYRKEVAEQVVLKVKKRRETTSCAEI